MGEILNSKQSGSMASPGEMHALISILIVFLILFLVMH